MNFKIIFILIFAVSCGVKGSPVSPKGSKTPSVLDNYPDINTDQPLNENKSN